VRLALSSCVSSWVCRFWCNWLVFHGARFRDLRAAIRANHSDVIIRCMKVCIELVSIGLAYVLMQSVLPLFVHHGHSNYRLETAKFLYNRVCVWSQYDATIVTENMVIG
jgi:hypothetical protein